MVGHFSWASLPRLRSCLGLGISNLLQLGGADGSAGSFDERSDKPSETLIPTPPSTSSQGMTGPSWHLPQSHLRRYDWRPNWNLIGGQVEMSSMPHPSEACHPHRNHRTVPTHTDRSPQKIPRRDPWDCHIYLHWGGGLGGQWDGIYSIHGVYGIRSIGSIVSTITIPSPRADSVPNV